VIDLDQEQAFLCLPFWNKGIKKTDRSDKINTQPFAPQSNDKKIY
jgi:hypothetical protein